MKNNWTLISILIGIISGVIAYLLTDSWKIALILSVPVTGISLWLNPKLFFARIAIYAFSALLGLNKFAFEATGKLFGVEFTLKNDTASYITTAFLGIISLVSLRYFFLERNGKLEGTFLDFSRNSNSVGSINGENITVNQNINKK
ncbi:hypothetical protein [uncultured Kordia sp.]|uniref:hypothetical protein n=1 Tax=uncultured Kordia sp. TaxID=507699 RepID=UPI00260B635B|nr:hypothetical protein [uncultured Kordia sp.]